MLALGRELLEPTVVARETLDEMTAVHFPGLSGSAPRLGRFDPLDWGLGVHRDVAADLDGQTGVAARVRPLRRLGRSSGSIPSSAIACAALTDRAFGDWAKEAWPALSDARRRRVRKQVTVIVGGSQRASAAVVGEDQPHELVEGGRVAVATTHGVIAVTVAVRGTPIAGATSQGSPRRIVPRSPSEVWDTLATPERST